MSIGNSSEHHIHLISFDIPVPVNYGGAIDIFYKIKSLSEAGIKIHLHCFQYGRQPDPDLDRLCETVNYYPRKSSPAHFLNRSPYIVSTRTSDELLKRITATPYPILFEGLHTCYYLDHPSLKNIRKVVRTHNIEHHYYDNLAFVEKNLLKKIYFRKEAWKLKRFENILDHASALAPISKKDWDYLTSRFPGKEICAVSAFHPFEDVVFPEGMGNFALYHGSLEVGENNQAALFLIREVFNDLGIPLVIAGNKPSSELVELARLSKNVSLRSDLKTEEIYKLIRQAQVNVLPTFQATGIKLKLLAALFTGRHCLVNEPMVIRTGLESLCTIAASPSDMKDQLIRLMLTPFTREESETRRSLLLKEGFINKANSEKLINMLFPPEAPRG